MSTNPANIYEADDAEFNEEKERLSSFDLPTRISIDAIGVITIGTSFLDVGAGPNTSLFEYLKSKDGIYTDVDINDEFLKQQKLAGANVARGDVRHLPFDNDHFDITHARFVVAHLGGDKLSAVREILRVTKPGGRAIILDYDWNSAHGSEAFDKIKDFMINGGFMFDADFGADLEGVVRSSGVDGKITRANTPPPPMSDYLQILKLREVGTADLKKQNKDAAAAAWNNLLDSFKEEAESTNPPGFFFPGIVAVTVTKE